MPKICFSTASHSFSDTVAPSSNMKIFGVEHLEAALAQFQFAAGFFG